MQTIVLAGGCFWCTQAVFARVRGVESVQCGYANGLGPQPSYAQVCSGHSGYAEVVRVAFDPAQIGLRQLLEIFMGTHDPTALNRQGHDVGPQYRSGIYYGSAEQAGAAQQLLAQLAHSRAYGDAPIVTELQPLRNYWPAEDEHQDYFALHPEQRYCALVIAPKVGHLQAAFAAALKSAGE